MSLELLVEKAPALMQPSHSTLTELILGPRIAARVVLRNDRYAPLGDEELEEVFYTASTDEDVLLV